ncbi:MAG: hypothetical protein LBE51_17615 [Acidovorax sp.]|nr:hypothetical protein [Acidovorax sp.]
MTRSALTKHAKIAPGVIHMLGLFVVASPCMAPQLNVSQKVGEMKCQFTGPEQLTVADLEVLLGLIALAGVQTDSFKSHRQLTGSNPDIRLRQMLTMQLVVRTTYSELARELGRSTGGATWPLLKQSIARLSAVRVIIKPIYGTAYDESPLFAPLRTDGSKDSIALNLSPVLAAAVLGGPGEFVQVSMEVFRSLKDKSGVACALYFRLHSLHAGQDHTITVDRLVKLVYGDDVPQASLRKSRSRVKAAMLKIAVRTGWSVEVENGVCRFHRPGKAAVKDTESS